MSTDNNTAQIALYYGEELLLKATIVKPFDAFSMNCPSCGDSIKIENIGVMTKIRETEVKCERDGTIITLKGTW